MDPGAAPGPWAGPPGALDGDKGICRMSGLADIAPSKLRARTFRSFGSITRSFEIVGRLRSGDSFTDTATTDQLLLATNETLPAGCCWFGGCSSISEVRLKQRGSSELHH